MAPTETVSIAPEKAEADLRAALSTPAQTETATPEVKADNASPQPEAKGTEAKPPTNTPADTSATTKTTEQKTETKPDNKSNYAKSQERLTKTWETVNAEKAEITKQKQEIESAKAQLAREQQTWQEKRAKTQSKATPEAHEQAARDKTAQAHTLNEQAEAYERSAAKLEEDGKLVEAVRHQDEAKRLRKQAAKLEAFADSHKEAADYARKNPDPTIEQLTAKKQQELQHYTMQAAAKWPDLGKNGSEFQNKVIGYIKNARENGIDENEYPAMRFYAAQLTAAELAAARVPELESKLGQAEARVKELEKLTSPGGGQSAAQAAIPAPQDFAKMSLEQQESWLRANTAR